MAGFADVPGTEIIVFYQKTVSTKGTKELQMTTQAGTILMLSLLMVTLTMRKTNVKHMFNDVALREKVGSEQVAIFIS